LGKLEDALYYYKTAIELEPDNSLFEYNCGVLFNTKSDYNEAVKILEKSIQNNKENVYAYLALGDALERLNQTKKAIYVYRDLLSLGIPVHGLKEKLAYLETIYEQNVMHRSNEKN
jgi:tetratricopeptide (TPR) repeat protein